VRGRQLGQVGAEFALVLGFLFTGGLAGLQFGGLAFDALKVGHAAQQAAYIAGSLPATEPGSTAPCWTVSGGLLSPGGLGKAPVCRAITENFGTLDAARASVQVDRTHGLYHVTITYAEPVTSPLLRLFFGDTFTTTQDAWSQ
jgi:hypothetical protein